MSLYGQVLLPKKWFVVPMCLLRPKPYLKTPHALYFFDQKLRLFMILNFLKKDRVFRDGDDSQYWKKWEHLKRGWNVHCFTFKLLTNPKIKNTTLSYIYIIVFKSCGKILNKKYYFALFLSWKWAFFGFFQIPKLVLKTQLILKKQKPSK